MRTRAIYGCLGPVLTAEECRFFADAKPWGFILFSRNVRDRDQLRRLVCALRHSVGDERAPVLIDQEGGRVARLGPPNWKMRTSAGRLGSLHEDAPAAARKAAFLNARIIAHDLAEVGISVNCVPVLDVPVQGADAIIGDRAFARDPATVIELGRATIEGVLEGGVLPVMKHVPGHGRATVDSHLSLPRVTAPPEELSGRDFVTFRSLNHCPLAMTAHVVYEAIDPRRPATTSQKVVRKVIRGEIGFEGLLLSDDLSMNALEGSLGERARAALFAGCDIAVHCNGRLNEMREMAQEAKPLEGACLERAVAAIAHMKTPREFDVEAGEAQLAQLLGAAA